MYVKQVVITSAILGLGLIVFFLSNEWNRAALGSSGYIEQGRKFGVIIGSDRQETIDNLVSKGLVDVSTLDLVKVENHAPQKCHGHQYENMVKVDLIWDRSWRQGTICLASKSDVIIKMSWEYGMSRP